MSDSETGEQDQSNDYKLVSKPKRKYCFKDK